MTERNMRIIDMEGTKKFFRENRFVGLIIVVAITAGIAGGVSGYWTAMNFSQPGQTVIARMSDNGRTDVITSDEETKVINVVRKVIPGVVSIVVTKDMKFIEQGYFNPLQEFCDDPFFSDFFGNKCDIPSRPSREYSENRQIGAGTGFVISSDGTILTNKHVVRDVDAEFTAVLSDGRKFPITVLARDPVQDIAILKINISGLTAIPLGDSSILEPGQTVIAIGNALGKFSNTVSRGVISGLSRSVTAGENFGVSEQLNEVIQTDTAINPGNSGGPLLNLSGQVIGINTAIAEGADRIGFAIPINSAKRDIEQVIRTGKISYPYLGIRYVMVNGDVKDKNNLSVGYGALIIRGSDPSELSIMPGSPAAEAGLHEGDIILELGGVRIDENNNLMKIIQRHNVGDTVMLKVLRKDAEKIFNIVLKERR